MNRTPVEPPAMSISRITAMSDGVFSIAITLLVFNIKVPDLKPHDVPAGLPAAVRALWPYLVSYVLSFIMIGVYWVGHHNIYHHIVRSNRLLLWLNLLFLMCVAFLPFAAALLGRYPQAQTALIVYGSTLICTGLALELLWRYATARGRMIRGELNAGLVRQASVKILTIPAVSVLSIALSWASPAASLALYLLVPLLYVMPNRLDGYWTRPAPQESNVSVGVKTGANRPMP